MAESVEQIDPTETLTADSIKARVVKGAAILTGRMVLIQPINFFSMVLLTAFLTPAEFGIYFVVSAIKNFLSYFSDIGFAPALIQKKEKLEDIELKTIFTAQQALILMLLLIVFVSTSLIADIYQLNQQAVYLLWALLFSLFLSSLKTIPSVILERKLEFNKWVIPQICETIVFNIIVVFLAWKGFGLTSYTVAVVLSGMVGLVIIYLVQPWLPGIAFSVKAFKSVLKFGIPYQMNTLLAMVKDDGMILFLGAIIGPAGVGFLGWAQKWAYAPLRFFMDQVIKVTFPAFSRLQGNRKDLSDLVSKSIFFVCLLVFPSLVILVLVSPVLVQVIPKYIKWSPALFALSVLAITSGLAAITTPLTNTLNAIGKISLTFKLMIMWTLLTWIFVPLLAFLYGVNGAAVGFTLVGLSSFVALFVVSKYIDINYLQAVGKPLLASVLMGVSVFLAKSILPVSFQQVILMAVAGLVSYSLVILMLEPKLVTLKKILLLIFFFLAMTLVPTISAQSSSFISGGKNSFISIVNPVRGSDFWNLKSQNPETAVEGQMAILSKTNLSATWLLRFDVLDNKNIISGLRSRPMDEKGLFLEITPTWTDQAKVLYQRSSSWHSAGSAFLTGYERSERERLIDTAFEKFKTIWGVFPQSVGAWWIDSYSLGYMQKKYGIISAVIVSDQYSTDNYQIWGQYFSTPYYPSKNNALHPAQNLENKLDLVITQWAPRDPVNSYGNGVMESTFSVQANDYIDYHNLDIKYFSSLVDIYTKQQFNSFAHVVVGIENSYEWGKYADEYQKQLEVLIEKRKESKLSVVPLKDFALWYRSSFPEISPAQLIIADDPLGSFKKTVWFMNPYYRIGWFLNLDGSVFRDIRQYISGEEELCFKVRCNSVNFATSATRVLDDISFGHKWVIDQGRISNFKVEKVGEEILISYTNEAGNLREMEFLPRDIGIDGKISSIDAAILNATKKDNAKLKSPVNSTGDLRWTFYSLILKLTEFALFLVFAVMIPGFILTKKLVNKDPPVVLRLFMSVIVGLVMLTLTFYVSSLFQIKPLIFIYILISLIIFIRNYSLIPHRLVQERSYLKNYHNFFGITKQPLNLILICVIIAGTLFQILPTFRSALAFGYGMGFWGPNAHDGVWHMALINQLIKSVPAENPIFSGTILKNYHFFYDLLIAATSYLSTIPVVDLVFRFYPVIFSLLLGVGSYYLVMRLFGNKLGLVKTKVAAIFSVYFVYFAGSFGWIVEYLQERKFGGESDFWVNQSVSFNLNPPFAVSLLILITIFHLLFSSTNLKSKIITAVLLGTLMSFKSYSGILGVGSVLVVAVINIIRRRDFSYLWITIFSSLLVCWLFISNFEIDSSLLIFAPFWFIHSMIDSPDRVGWVRMSLARTSSLAMAQWPKFILVEAISLVIFIFGNLGLRVLSFGAFFRVKEIFKNDVLMLIFIVASLSVIIPIFFVQSGNPWNTIQFFYPALYLSTLFSGVVISFLIFKLNKVFASVLISMILILAPINSIATASGYLRDIPHALVGSKELEGLQFLSRQPDGVVLAYPYDNQLKTKLAEPWPLFVYGSTAYVSALSKKSVYLEDEPQNQILLTDYKKRLIASKDFFLKPVTENTGFLLKNQIRYIYIPAIFNVRLDENTKTVKNIFENEAVIIYKVI